MTETKLRITELRKERGWSQERLASISGVSERTIQRVEKENSCSLETKMALASAFDLAPSDLTRSIDLTPESIEFTYDWSGSFGLFVCGLAIPAIVLLTGTEGVWELVSFAVVIGLSIIFSIMHYGLKETYLLLDKTSWIVRYPSYASNLNNMISHATSLIKSTYVIGSVATIVTGLTIAVHRTDMLDSHAEFITICIRPLVYAFLFVELWFRPYKRKMERMLKQQLEIEL